MRPIGKLTMSKKEAEAFFGGVRKVGKSTVNVVKGLFPKRGKAKKAYQKSK